MEKKQKKPAKAKNLGGRPKLPAEKVKDRRLDDVRFSALELASLKERAAAAGVPWSAWVRGRLGL